MRLRPCCAFNLGGLSFAWCLADPHSCLGLLQPRRIEMAVLMMEEVCAQVGDSGFAGRGLLVVC